MSTMTAAEFKVTRERLGLSASWVASSLGVTEKSISRWESGEDPVNVRAATFLRNLHQESEKMIKRTLTAIGKRKSDGPVLLKTYRMVNPSSIYPASFHRAMTGRLALLIDREVEIVYADA